MKDFDVSTITTSGVQLLAQATNGNRLVVSGCEANTTVYTAETAKAVTEPTGTRISNEIELVGVQDNKIIVRARFTQSETTGGNANSLVLFGRLENDPEETRTAICVVSNNAQFYLPSSTSEAVQDFECIFTIDYEIQSNVVVEQTSALECSLAEFRLLKERTVTSHKEGDPNIGDPTQNIFGEKVFQSQIGFVEEANFTSVATFNGGIAVNGDAEFANDATFKNNIILPDKTSDGFSAGNIQIGNLKAFSTCATLSQDGISFENEEMNHHRSTSYNSDGISIYGGNAPSFTVSSKELSWSGVGSDPSFKITDNGELFLYQKSDKTFGLTATNHIEEVTLTTDYVVCRKQLTSDTIICEKSISSPVYMIKGTLFGDCEMTFNKNNLLCKNSGGVNLGSNEYPFYSVYCNSIVCENAPDGLIRKKTITGERASGLILVILSANTEIKVGTDVEIYDGANVGSDVLALIINAAYSSGDKIQKNDGVKLLEAVKTKSSNTPVYALAWKKG